MRRFQTRFLAFDDDCRVIELALRAVRLDGDYALFRWRIRLATGITFAIAAVGGFILLNSSFRLATPRSIGISMLQALLTPVFINLTKLSGRVLVSKGIGFWSASPRMFARASHPPARQLSRSDFRLYGSGPAARGLTNQRRFRNVPLSRCILLVAYRDH